MAWKQSGTFSGRIWTPAYSVLTVASIGGGAWGRGCQGDGRAENGAGRKNCGFTMSVRDFAQGSSWVVGVAAGGGGALFSVQRRGSAPSSSPSPSLLLSLSPLFPRGEGFINVRNVSRERQGCVETSGVGSTPSVDPPPPPQHRLGKKSSFVPTKNFGL